LSRSNPSIRIKDTLDENQRVSEHPVGDQDEPRSKSAVSVDQVRDHDARRWWRLPSFELNAVALMSATAITGVVGLAFWAVAARLPPAEVGRASAILSTATMLSQLSSSNMGVLFGRVLAAAGAKSRSVVLGGYGIAVALSLVLGAAFVLVIPNQLLTGTAERVTFPLLVALFSLFALQDWVLTGIRKSVWVPVEQLFFAIGKLGLLLLFSVWALQNGIVLSWMLPCLLAVLVVNAVLLGRTLPRRRASGATDMPDRRGLARIFLAEYATGAVMYVVPLTLPLLVVAVLGTEANAYYAVPWLIGESLGLLIFNISSSYLVEAAHDSQRIATLMARTIRLIALVAVPGVAVVLIAAPWILSILGPEYAAEGSTVLRLMVLAIPFSTVSTLYVAICRIRLQMARVVVIEAMIAVLVIGLAVALIRPLGIAGVGLGYLIAEIVVAAATIMPLVRFLRANQFSIRRR
jgi:O-antigen/teichoic acid export membrane protein